MRATPNLALQIPDSDSDALDQLVIANALAAIDATYAPGATAPGVLTPPAAAGGQWLYSAGSGGAVVWRALQSGDLPNVPASAFSRSVAVTTLAANVALAGTAWTDVLGPMGAFTLTQTQAVLFLARIVLQNTGASVASIELAIYDRQAHGATWQSTDMLAYSGRQDMGATGTAGAWLEVTLAEVQNLPAGTYQPTLAASKGSGGSVSAVFAGPNVAFPGGGTLRTTKLAYLIG